MKKSKRRKYHRDRYGRFVSKKSKRIKRRPRSLLRRKKRRVKIKRPERVKRSRQIKRSKRIKRSRRGIPRRKIQKTRSRRLRQRVPGLPHRLRRRLRARRRPSIGPSRKRRVTRRRLPRRRRAVARAVLAARAGRPVGRWIPTQKIIKRLKKEWSLEDYRSDYPGSQFKWFLSGQKWLGWNRKFPPGGKHFKYVVFGAWFIVYNEEDDEHYLWMRRTALTRKITFADYARLVKKDKSLAGLSLTQLELHLPVEVRAPQGIGWQDVLKRKTQLIREMEDSIESDAQPQAASPGGYYVVQQFIGWTAYPGAGTKL